MNADVSTPTRAERMANRLAWPVVAAALATIPLLIIEEQNPHGTLRSVAHVADWVVWLIFLADYVLMFAVADNRRRYLLHNPVGLAIVVLTPPFLPVGVQWLRVLRIVRLVRLLRVPRMLKLKLGIETLEYAALLVVLSLLGGAAAFSAAERIPYGDAVYWAIGTMTTAGYGDIRPTTTLAKVVSCVLMVIGTGFFALVTGAIAQRFLAPDVKEIEQAVAEVEVDVDSDVTQLINQIRALGTQVAELETTLETTLAARQRRGSSG